MQFNCVSSDFIRLLIAGWVIESALAAFENEPVSTIFINAESELISILTLCGLALFSIPFGYGTYKKYEFVLSYHEV